MHDSEIEGIAGGIAIVIRDDVLPKINESITKRDQEIATLRARIEALEKQFETKDRKSPTRGGKR